MIVSTEKRNPELMLPLVTGWLSKIREAGRAREKHDDVAKQCMNFFSGSVGFMWDSGYASKYMGGAMSPRFKITLQKAFELVALFGPILYWRNPIRIIKPRKKLDLSPEMFGDPNDPNVQQFFQQMMMQDQQTKVGERIRNELMSLYLNYTPDEMPNGGLASHAEIAITEALVKGRGVLWPHPYKFPGSDRTLTGCFYDTRDNLYIDPDATSLDDAWWIAQRVVEPVWKVEKRYGLPNGSMANKGQYETATAMAERSTDPFNSMHRAQGKTNDLIAYYKVWSKMGVGSRLTGIDSSLKSAFDKVVGDYAYIVVAEGVPHPLNANSDRVFDKSSSDEEVQSMFQWPVPFWRDDRWPFVELDFYRKPGSPYPIAPMEPGLGELTYMNIFMSHLAGRIWSSSRDFIAVLEEARVYVEKELKSGSDLAIIGLPPGLGKNINEIVQFLDQPNINTDAWRIMSEMSNLFERRTGLSELLYGMNPGGVQSRTATDIEAKREAVSVRPEYMSGKVEDWMTRAADMEKFCARWFVEGSDVRELVGPIGAELWDQHITTVDPEVIVREMRATVEAGSSRKPNRQRDAQNMQAVLPVMFPELSKHADATGDTNPLNQLLAKWGGTIDQDVQDMFMGPRRPEPPPPEEMQAQQQAQQMQMEMESQKQQAEVAKTQVEVEKARVDMHARVLEVQAKQMEMSTEQAPGASQADEELEASQVEMAIKAREFEQKLELERSKHEQELAQDQDDHEREMIRSQEKHELELSQIREEQALKQKELDFKESEMVLKQGDRINESIAKTGEPDSASQTVIQQGDGIVTETIIPEEEGEI